MLSTSKFNEIRKYGGYRALVKVVLSRLAHKILRLQLSYVIIVLPDESNISPELPSTELRFKCLDWEEILEFAKDPENQFYKPILEEASRNGDRCFAVLHENELVSFCWYSTRPTYKLGSKKCLHFDDSYYCCYHIYTKPAYRGQGIASVISRRVMNVFLEEGLKGEISLVEWSNFRSLHSFFKRNAHIVGRVYRWQPRKKVYIRVVNKSRGINFDFRDTEPENSVGD